MTNYHIYILIIILPPAEHSISHTYLPEQAIILKLYDASCICEVIASKDRAVGGGGAVNIQMQKFVCQQMQGLSLSSDTISLLPLTFIVKYLGNLLTTSYGPS